MTPEQMERTIEFLLEHHAKFSADIDRLTETQQRLTESQQQLTETVARMASDMETDRRESRAMLDGVITEMRDGFDKLIVANEVTRDLASKVAALEVQTSQRVTGLERRVDDLEK